MRTASSSRPTLHILSIGAGQLVAASLLLGTKQQGHDRSVPHVLEALSVERKEGWFPMLGENHHCGEERESLCAWLFCFHSCPRCLQQFTLGMAEMRRLLLVLLYITRSSATECDFFLS